MNTVRHLTRPHASVSLLLLVLAVYLFTTSPRRASGDDTSPGLVIDATTQLAHPSGEAYAASGVWQPFLYTIDAPHLTRPSFIFGTIHVPDDRVQVLPAVVQRALNASEAIYNEIPLHEQAAFTHAMMLPADKTLADVLPADLYNRLQRFFARKGRDLATFDRFNLWGIMMIMVLIDSLENLQPPLDTNIMLHALNWGKTYRGLETVEEQLAVFSMFSQQELIEILDASLTQLETATINPLEELLRVYLKGEAVKLHEQIDKHLQGHPDLIARVQQHLFHERDVRFAERIDQHLLAQSDIQHFFAIGAGHLVIPGGVLDHLRARGYTIERQWNDE